MFGEEFFKEVVGQDDRLEKAVYTMVDFEVDPTISDEVKEIVFVDKVLRDV